MQILSTKLTAPPLRKRLVARLRLIQKLNQGLGCGFVLVSAPAGYGKSTLLIDWLRQLEYPVAWLSLDDGDNDPVRFLTYLLAALRQVRPSVGEALEISLRAVPLPDVETLLTPLVNELAGADFPCCLVLDDYHLIQDQRIHRLVSFLLERRPPSLHLTIATRADPPLPLARLRGRAEMLELRQADLCFTAREAAEFLYHTMGLRISSDDVARITARTEGWIAGLQMAALSMQSTDDVSGFISTLTGSHHYIFDYLLEEILGRQAPEIRRFLLYTSILDQLTAPLCDALLKEDSESYPTRSSTVILEELEHANLFIASLDYEQRWYRYHHLFSDLLRLMLEKAYPGLSAELHCRACQWYETQGMLSEALQHALSSGNMQLVAQVVSANVLVLVEHDAMVPTLRKIESLLQEKIAALPWLGIACAWAMSVGNVTRAHQVLDSIEVNVRNAPDTAEHQRLEGQIAAARAYAFYIQGDVANTIEHARLANEVLPADEIAVRALNLANWGSALLIDRFNSSAEPVSMARYNTVALPILEQALALALQAEKPHVAMIAATDLASAHLFAGKLHELHRVCMKALAISDDYQRRFQRPLSAAASVYALFARLYVEWGEYEKAIQYGQKGLILSERWGRMNIEANCLVYLGRALIFNNDLEQAYKVLEQAEDVAQKISSRYWQRFSIFILETLLDCERQDAGAIAQQLHRIRESGARVPALVKVRLLLRDNQPAEALEELGNAILEVNGQPSLDNVRIYALRALAFQAMGDEKQALAELRQALESGEPENRVATFVREGAAMERLLRVEQAKSNSPAFVQRLLDAFESRHRHRPMIASSPVSLVEPLSEREMEVLRLLAQGCTDKNIAEALVIARETVHKHLKNIYGKLDVHSRSEAIARAHQLTLL